MFLTIPGYRIETQIYESNRSAIFRAVRLTDNLPVILKALNPITISREAIGRLQREYTITQQLAGPGIITALDFITAQPSPVIVMEDYGGQSIASLLHTSIPTLADTLTIAIQIGQALGSIHQQNIIHKDINPANILWNPQQHSSKIIDFGLASTLSRENPEIRNSNILEGTLAYISPEQTGRMNRAMDYRSDFYSFGAALYHMLTGAPPFTGQEAMELVHAHIARQPLPPHQINTAVPEPLSHIVLKLLAKNAEDRYQSAFGLVADLQQCQQAWQSTGRIAPFPLAQKDIAARFQLPQKQYGRTTELTLLNQCLQQTTDPTNGRTHLALISSPPGMGKSTLIHEFNRLVTRQNITFLNGKFDAQQQPYAPLLDALSEFISQTLMTSEETITQWRTLLQETLGANIQLIRHMLPTLDRILGPQPTATPLPTSETDARFQAAFQQLFQVLARPEHPLVLFIDDWQWMDSDTGNLLHYLLVNQRTSNLLLIGAIRPDGEITANQPAHTLLTHLTAANAPITHLELHPFTLADTHQFVADTLHQPLDVVRPLAELVQQKTGGSPFFLSEFLTTLYQNGAISFNFTHGQWEWDLPQIQTQDITDNVVDLMIQRIKTMDIKSQMTLMLAACIGSQFDLQTVALAYGYSSQRTAVDLHPAIDHQFLIPLSDAHQLAELGTTLNAEYKFVHSRIQQAAYSLVPPNDRLAIHQQIGQHLLTALSATQQESYIFAIVRHLNLARSLCTSPTAQQQLITLNIQAAQKAMQSYAYAPAYTYTQIALELLEPAATTWWQQQYDLTLNLYQTAVQATFSTGNHSQMQQYITTILQNAHTLLHKIPAYSIQLRYYTAQNQIPTAIEIALPLLKELGFTLPRYPKQHHLILTLLQTRRILKHTPPPTLLNQPPLTDPSLIAAADIMYSIGSAAYFALPELFAIIVLKLVQINATHGIHSQGPPTFAAYGLMLTGYLNNSEQGYALGQMALTMARRPENRYAYPQTVQLYAHYLHPWKASLRIIETEVRQAHQIAIETGNQEMMAYTAYTNNTRDFYAGKELAQLLPEMAANLTLMRSNNQQKLEQIQSVFLQMITNLYQNSPDPWLLQGDYCNETAVEQTLRDNQDNPSLCTFLIQKATLHYLFGQYPQAHSYSQRAIPLLTAVAATYMVAYFTCLQSLIRLAQWPTLTATEQRQALKQARKHHRQLQKWATGCPANFSNKVALLAAEIARVQGHTPTARTLYEQAIQLAKDNQFIQEEALAFELAARFHLEIGHPRMAQHYLQQAAQTYERWNATAKVQHLYTTYPQHIITTEHPTHRRERFPGNAIPFTTTATFSTTSGTISSSSMNITEALDLASILKASQALSREIVLENLLRQLMNLVIENAGAQSGYFLLPHNGRWQVAAIGGNQTKADTPLPQSILNYVTRTWETVVLDNAAAQSAYTQDPVISHRQPKSVLCLPLHHNDNLVGLLYLENNLSTAVFTTDRLITLNLIASQATIALENAQLYQQLETYGRTLEDQVAERTAALATANHTAQEARALAEVANENKSIFLSNMSHELRTPLNSIIGFTRIVLRRSNNTLPEKQTDNLNKVLISADHLVSLINTVLDIARIEAGQMELYPTTFQAPELIEACLATTRPLLQPGVSILTEYAPHLPPIYSDPAKIKQIIINLISNAAKFTHQGQITLTATQQDGQLIIHVSDSGIGISQEALPRIFEEFQQAESTTRQQYGGTGLGLPISRSLARLLGGDLTASSVLGQGSTFTLTIPVHYEKFTTTTPQEPA
jgi:predicted ATPase/signal transduction histidine kinase/tRNA A-37 threonylcarbamoyl transferase component Bud32